MAIQVKFLWGAAIPIIISILFLQPYIIQLACDNIEPICAKALKPIFGVCSSHKSTYAMVKPGSVVHSHYQVVLSAINQDKEIYLVRSKKVWLSEAAVKELYAEHVSRPFYNDLVFYIASGPVIVMEISGKDSVVRWRSLIGPTDPSTAKIEAPLSIRSKIGFSKTMNSVHGSDSDSAASRELELMFSKKSHLETFDLPTAGFNYSLLVIQPSALNFEKTILKRLSLQGFTIQFNTSISLSEHTSSKEIHQNIFYNKNSTDDSAPSVEFEKGESLVLALKREDAIQGLIELMGKHYERHQSKNPNRLFTLYGTSLLAAKNHESFKLLAPLLLDKGSESIMSELP
ncbi:50S ribosomal protein L3 [Entomophthora muscae]|uniref:50S ribosomal protein L3 n=1 Tax=Entomophthora muscae TaxID=34485 RepID=A0ACC2RXJ1_9FUNG|nr:50S ribosomal protein L3 [Entomophthora muscae]